VWVLLMFSFAGVNNKGLSIYPFVNAALVRDAMVMLLVVLVVREIVRPDRDLVRVAGDDDPSGGPLENAPDRFRLPSLPALWRRRRSANQDETVTAEGAPVRTVADSSDGSMRA
jgi:hypothetical protein